MTKITILAALSLATVALVPTLAQADVSRNNNRGIAPLVQKVATCLVTGGGADFTDDVLLINKGARVIKAGDKIDWKVPGFGQGSHTLVADLSPKQTVHLLNVLDIVAHAGEPCSADVK